MRLPVFSAPTRVRPFLDRPRREVWCWLLLLNVGILLLALIVGRPLGDLKHHPLSIWTPLHALCAAEVICTVVSVAQLLLCAWVLSEVYLWRRQQLLAEQGSAARACVWYLMHLGFLFLAVDDLVGIHEGLDKLLHWTLGVKETRWTDRLDDVIPLGYALIGLAVLGYCRRELRQFRHFWPELLVGMGLLLNTQFLDALTNRRDMLQVLIADKQLANLCWAKLNALEEGVKLLGESVFLLMFWGCLGACRESSTADVLPFTRAVRDSQCGLADRDAA